MNELTHYGIEGMKWGVRRYQNPDGTLTEAGKKRYERKTGTQIHKEFAKQIKKKQRAIALDDSRLVRSPRTPIGENSKKVIEEDKLARKQYENSLEYKKFEKEWNKKYKKFNQTGEWDEDDDERLYALRPKENWNTLSYARKGKEYMNDFLEKGGKDLSIAYLKDLGYEQKTAEQLVDKMIKSNRTLGDL